MSKLLKYVLICFCASFTSYNLTAQLGGQEFHDFLRSPSNARVTALGSSVIHVLDSDVSLSIQNPALLNIHQHKQLNFSYNFHFAGIKEATINTAYSLDSMGLTFQFGVQFVNFGDFIAADIIGNTQGTFDAGETALILGVGKQMNERIRMGFNVKPIFSQYESYSAFSIAHDLGFYYEIPGKNWSLGLVGRNFGYQVSSFTSDKAPLPFDLQFGYARKLAHLPFRFSVIAHQLHRLDIRYDDPNQIVETDFFGNELESSPFNNTIDNIFRHLILSGEFLFGKKEAFNLRFAYNHLRRKEMSLSSLQSLAGFSLGIGIQIRKFKLDYGIGHYHIAGATNHLSIRVNLQEWVKF